MARVAPRSFALLAFAVGLVGACVLLALAAAAPAHQPVKAIAFSSSQGEVLRSGGASLRSVPAQPTAPADQAFAVGTPAMAAAENVAHTYWGDAAPCGGQVDIQWTDLTTDTNAISTWSNPTSAYDNPKQNSDCHIALNRLLEFDWSRFCTVLVHEFGHLTGHAHSPDPNNVMTAIYNGPVDVCLDAPAPAPAVTPATPAPKPTATAASRSTTRAAKARTHRVRKHRTHRHTRRHHRLHARHH